MNAVSQLSPVSRLSLLSQLSRRLSTRLSDVTVVSSVTPATCATAIHAREFVGCASGLLHEILRIVRLDAGARCLAGRLRNVHETPRWLGRAIASVTLRVTTPVYASVRRGCFRRG